MPFNYDSSISSVKNNTSMLWENEYLRKYILDTRPLSKRSLEKMLFSYELVAFKPDTIEDGNHNGVMVRMIDGSVNLHLKTEKYEFCTIGELLDFIINLDTEKSFLLQQGVKLLKYHERPLNIHIDVKKECEDWAVSKISANISPKNEMPTDENSNDHEIPLDSLFADISVSDNDYREFRGKIYAFALICAYELDKKLDGLRELIFSIGVDEDFTPYILRLDSKS